MLDLINFLVEYQTEHSKTVNIHFLKTRITSYYATKNERLVLNQKEVHDHINNIINKNG